MACGGGDVEVKDVENGDDDDEDNDENGNEDKNATNKNNLEIDESLFNVDDLGEIQDELEDLDLN